METRPRRLSFEQKLELGHDGEMLVVPVLQQRGWGVIPSYDYSGTNGDKAPKLMFTKSGLCVPDLDLCREGERFWLEVKTYHGPAVNHRHRCQVHGIPRRLAGDYAQVEFQSGCSVFLAVLEVESGDLLVSRLSSLMEKSFGCQCGPCESKREDFCTAPIKRGVYWDRREMQVLTAIDDVTMEPIRVKARSFGLIS